MSVFLRDKNITIRFSFIKYVLPSKLYYEYLFYVIYSKLRYERSFLQMSTSYKSEDGNKNIEMKEGFSLKATRGISRTDLQVTPKIEIEAVGEIADESDLELIRRTILEGMKKDPSIENKRCQYYFFMCANFNQYVANFLALAHSNRRINFVSNCTCHQTFTLTSLFISK